MDKTAAILSIPNSDKTLAWAQFNKITGEFTGVFQKVDVSTLNQDYYDYVAIEINIETQRVSGTKNNFKIVNVADEPQLQYEIALNNQAQGKIDKEYNIYARLEMIDRMLGLLCEKLDVQDEAFIEMRDYIDEVHRVNAVIKEAVSNDPAYHYVSIADQLEQEDAKIEGGLHEFFGPRETTPQIVTTPFV
jgi:hypothetical protein